MQKTISVDNKLIAFECNLLSLLIHRQQFGRNFLTDINDVNNIKNRLIYEDVNIEMDKLDKVYSVIWTLAKTANDTISSPDTWIDRFKNFDVYEIWDKISNDVVRDSLAYDKRYRTDNTNNNGGQRNPTAEELTAIFLELGLSVADFKYFTIGMGINLIKSAEIREKKRRNIEVSDPEEQYLKLKANEKMIDELHEKGEISEEKYKSYKDTIARWEDGR